MIGVARLVRRLGFLVALAAAVAGCSGSGPPGASGGGGGNGAISDINVCALLTPAEIESALGKPVAAGVPAERTGNSSGCDWEGASDSDAVAISVTIDEFNQDFWNTAKGTEGVEPMAGLGDEAIRGWITPSVVLIKYRNMEIDLAVISLFDDEDVVRPAQETLGKLVVSRL